jgi:hypothetical protein
MSLGAALIKAGSMPMDDKQGEPLLAIVEAGSPVDWEEARTRLSAQCIALLKSTYVDSFSPIFLKMIFDNSGKWS